MHIANGFNVDSKQYVSRREDLSFIVRFNWKTSTHLKEAIKVLLASRQNSADSSNCVKKTEQRCDILDDGEYHRIRRIIATNPNTPASVLAYLAKHGNTDTLERVAENPRTPLSALEHLARSSFAHVRSAVAENINVSPDILTILGADDDVDVRYRLAENPHLPEELLVALTEDQNPYVRFRAETTLQRVAGGTVIAGPFARGTTEDREKGIR